MKNKQITRIVETGVTLALIALVAISCTTPTTAPTSAPAATTAPTAVPATTAPTDVPAPELAGDSVRGGLLYDEWWAVVGASAPMASHQASYSKPPRTKSPANSGAGTSVGAVVAAGAEVGAVVGVAQLMATRVISASVTPVSMIRVICLFFIQYSPL
jgi:hypothetical protein